MNWLPLRVALIRGILLFIWKSLFALNFAIGLLVLYPLFYLLLLRRAWFKYAFALKRFWAKWITIVPGIVVVVDKKIDLRKLKGPVVFCANHVSYLDIVVSYIVVSKYFVFMGKQELDKAPLFRIFFKEMNILVNRKSKFGSHKALMKAGEELSMGNSVFLFPEGTISKDAKLKHFKSGAFKLAIDKQVPIVPITFLNNWKMLQNGGFFKSNGRPGISRVVVHEPVYTDGLTDEDLVNLRGRVHKIILKDLEEYESR